MRCRSKSEDHGRRQAVVERRSGQAGDRVALLREAHEYTARDANDVVIGGGRAVRALGEDAVAVVVDGDARVERAHCFGAAGPERRAALDREHVAVRDQDLVRASRQIRVRSQRPVPAGAAVDAIEVIAARAGGEVGPRHAGHVGRRLARQVRE